VKTQHLVIAPSPLIGREESNVQTDGAGVETPCTGQTITLNLVAGEKVLIGASLEIDNNDAAGTVLCQIREVQPDGTVVTLGQMIVAQAVASENQTVSIGPLIRSAESAGGFGTYRYDLTFQRGGAGVASKSASHFLVLKLTPVDSP